MDASEKGNAWVRRLLCEFAQAAGRSRCAFKDKFQALNVRWLQMLVKHGYVPAHA